MDCSRPRLLCPWDSPGRNTGVGCHSLLQMTIMCTIIWIFLWMWGLFHAIKYVSFLWGVHKRDSAGGWLSWGPWKRVGKVPGCAGVFQTAPWACHVADEMMGIMRDWAHTQPGNAVQSRSHQLLNRTGPTDVPFVSPLLQISCVTFPDSSVILTKMLQRPEQELLPQWYDHPQVSNVPPYEARPWDI